MGGAGAGPNLSTVEAPASGCLEESAHNIRLDTRIRYGPGIIDLAVRLDRDAHDMQMGNLQRSTNKLYAKYSDVEHPSDGWGHSKQTHPSFFN